MPHSLASVFSGDYPERNAMPIIDGGNAVAENVWTEIRYEHQLFKKPPHVVLTPIHPNPNVAVVIGEILEDHFKVMATIPNVRFSWLAWEN